MSVRLNTDRLRDLDVVLSGEHTFVESIGLLTALFDGGHVHFYTDDGGIRIEEDGKLWVDAAAGDAGQAFHLDELAEFAEFGELYEKLQVLAVKAMAYFGE